MRIAMTSDEITLPSLREGRVISSIYQTPGNSLWWTRAAYAQ